MSAHNDPVQPIPFDVVQPAPLPGTAASPAEPRRQQGTPGWVWPALGALVVLALLVFFLLPAALENGHSTPTAETTPAAEPAAPATGTAGEATGKPATTGADTTPWSDAQQARARKEAQEVLQQLLDLQFALQERGVEQWAGEAFAKVAAMAADGDALYKNRQYDEAKQRYQQGLDDLQALQSSMPQRLQQLLEQAQHALDNGDAAAATVALATATLIAPDDASIAKLQHRAQVLPQLLPLLDSAASAEASGDLAQAQVLLQQASALDPLHARAQSELQRVTAKLRDQGFNTAMSEGYAALSAGHFDSARKAFNTAAKLQPQSSEAASALQEVASAQTAQRLATLEAQGQREEQQEQWQKAVTTYEQAQKVDKSVLFASEGLKRSRERAQLDAQLRKAIAEPQRLADTAVAAATAQLLARAQQVTPRGPALAQQIQQLGTVLAQANTTVTVTLRSDQATEVTVYKVARLGRFEQQELTLRPGTYTALGTRDGYRDVRQTFTVTHNGPPAPVTVVCSERI